MKRALPVLAGLLAASALGCHTVQEVGYPAEFVSENAPSHVWVTTAEQPNVEIWNPHLDGDTLVGFAKGEYWEVPVSRVKLMRASFVAPARTVAAASVVLIGTAFVVSQAISGTTGQTSFCYAPGTDSPIVCPAPANCPNNYRTGVNGC